MKYYYVVQRQRRFVITTSPQLRLDEVIGTFPYNDGGKRKAEKLLAQLRKYE